MFKLFKFLFILGVITLNLTSKVLAKPTQADIEEGNAKVALYLKTLNAELTKTRIPLIQLTDTQKVVHAASVCYSLEFGESWDEIYQRESDLSRSLGRDFPRVTDRQYAHYFATVNTLARNIFCPEFDY